MMVGKFRFLDFNHCIDVSEEERPAFDLNIPTNEQEIFWGA